MSVLRLVGLAALAALATAKSAGHVVVDGSGEILADDQPAVGARAGVVRVDAHGSVAASGEDAADDDGAGDDGAGDASETPLVIAIADVHGDRDAFESILQSLGVIQRVPGQTRYSPVTKQTEPLYRLTLPRDSVFVNTGDVVDRGDSAAAIYELLYLMQHKAPGRVRLVYGNHEIMNILGQMDYVSPGDVAEFGGWEKRNRAWSPTGWVGRMLATLGTVDGAAKPGHGPLLVSLPPQPTTNSTAIPDDVAAVRAHDDDMLLTGNVMELPVPTAGGYNVMTRVGHMLFGHAGALAHHAKEFPTLQDLNNAFNFAVRTPTRSHKLLYDTGPVWQRVSSQSSEQQACFHLQKVLSAYGGKRMVIGHTPSRDGRAKYRCKQQLILLDTLISNAYHGMGDVFYSGLKVWADGRAEVLYPTRDDKDKLRPVKDEL